ncbi:ATP-binding protein [Sphingobium sufflavum]|uniref:ATP-binding protein n=1 Tax=Sphingobium sufflavum TaxID=1129547 RepID=UPI001F215987|nr:ATP-binding protein [Sphingobium sufflavum]MCE7795547.1 ATP-binding protein [Sphingobium sufflavum]
MSQLSLSDGPPDFRFEAVLTVFSRLPGTLIVSFINALLIVLMVGQGSLSANSLAWLICVGIVSVGRGIAAARFRVAADPRSDISFWVRVSVLGAILSGMLWGVGPIFPMTQATSSQWIWAFVIGGSCAGAASLHAAHLPTALGFTIPALLPFALSLLLQGTMQSMAAAAMTFAFLGVTSFTAISFSRDFQRTQLLGATLAARAHELNAANERLKREIGDHKSTSEALYQAQKMEALGSLTGGFAHDFNNILTVIISNLEAILLKSPLHGTRALTTSAIMAAESGADLISRLLAFARKQTLQAQSGDLIRIVEEFRALLLHAVSGDIRIEFDLCPSPAMANIDAAQFQAMLLNLVVNARDALPHGGLIRVTVAVTVLDGDMPGGMDVAPGRFASISVRDDGDGMSPQTIERAFEPFFTTKGEGRGSGLGLAQVYGFARQSGGFARIDSVLGQGTNVTLFIPIVEGEAVVAPAQAVERPAPAARAPLSILLVDDSQAVLSALREGLAEESWTIVSARDALSALDAVGGGGRFDIVITDMDMPGGMGGHALATQLRDDHGLPVLLMSGVPLAADGGAGGFAFIAKPFRKQALVDMVHSVVQRAGR